jgi:hypothetical protein
VAAASNRQLITAVGSGHYITRGKSQLVVEIIPCLYREP